MKSPPRFARIGTLDAQSIGRHQCIANDKGNNKEGIYVV
jgi:hypothetical protein